MIIGAFCVSHSIVFIAEGAAFLDSVFFVWGVIIGVICVSHSGVFITEGAASVDSFCFTLMSSLFFLVLNFVINTIGKNVPFIPLFFTFIFWLCDVVSFSVYNMASFPVNKITGWHYFMIVTATWQTLELYDVKV